MTPYRPVPKAALDFLKEHEACVLRVYDDAHPNRKLGPASPVEGTLTAGYGHTGFLTAGMAVTQDMADRWLAGDAEHAAELVAERIGAVVDELTAFQYAALICFVFNTGAGKDWTIWKRLRARQFDQVPAELARFVNTTRKDPATGKKVTVKLAGLVKRRAAETVLWSTAEPGSSALPQPSSVTREADTPPTPVEPDAHKSAQLIAGAAAAVAGAPVVLNQVTQAIQPYAEHSAVVQQAIGVLATVTAVMAVAALALTWLKARQAKS